ncbi:MAG: CinA family nicotinamide mononucleotide deamidase-related protein [SAR324 cluster bacterium]|nr:CinA family nicotinamide mononucleotide deamidase-related protein [SAR324 cluster bacterium]
MNIEVICTGDEVLTGKIVNSNYAFIAQKLEDYGLSVQSGLTVGDDREALLEAFLKAGERADAVIVNGGLGPTVDDLSQEVAAQAAGVELVLHESWLYRMERFFQSRGRTMPPNNRKQAMLPEGAEMLDNPIGTACGFAVGIGKATFFFTPGVPRELFRMLDEQILPRLLGSAGDLGVIVLRRFHSFGLGESHVDQLLSGLEEMDPDGTVKLGFRAHYPQLETKLVCHAPNHDVAREKLEPIEAEVYRRIGNFILAVDDETHESVVRGLIEAGGGSLAVIEDITGGRVAQRLSALPGAERFFVNGTVALTAEAKRNDFGAEDGDFDWATAPDEAVALRLATAVRERAGSSHGLAVIGRYDGEPRGRAGHVSGTINYALAAPGGVVSRQAELTGSRDWVSLGAAEMGLDVLRRHLKGLPIDERIDFEKTDSPPSGRAG